MEGNVAKTSWKTKNNVTAPQLSIFEEIIVDNFAGGGGASTGIELAAGRPVAIAINHDPDAILLHKTNHPFTEHLQASVWDVKPKEVCRGRPVGLAWFSPDCKHFSKAKGAALVDRKIRGLAWIVLRWAATVRPRVILLENVEEFQTWGPVRNGKPVRKHAGETFLKWKKQLSDLGYEIEHRELVAADYGAPTTRKRFVLVARCDGKPIRWPERTHAPADSKEVKEGKLKPWRSAAEIIDWTIPGYSIFESKEALKEKYGVKAVRPLADNTLRRIIRGVDKFTIKSGKPFIIQQKFENAPQSIDKPLTTITSVGSHEICDPILSPFTVTNTSNSVGSPADQPVHTVTTAGNQILGAANLIQYHTEQTENVRASGLNAPINTVDASNRYGLASCQLVEYYSTGRPLDIREPMHTATTHDREAVVAAHIAEFKGQDTGQPMEKPLRTITQSAGEFGQCFTVLTQVCNGTDFGYWPQIRGLLNKYCGYSMGEDEILLINIHGILYYIADITLRMLTPRELYNAMGFPPDYQIERDYKGNVYPRTKQVARCGNAVCPPMAEAMVKANLPEWYRGKITTMEKLHSVVAV